MTPSTYSYYYTIVQFYRGGLCMGIWSPSNMSFCHCSLKQLLPCFKTYNCCLFQDAGTFAKKLLYVLFSEEQLARSNCTKVVGRELLDQTILTGIKYKLFMYMWVWVYTHYVHTSYWQTKTGYKYEETMEEIYRRSGFNCEYLIVKLRVCHDLIINWFTVINRRSHVTSAIAFAIRRSSARPSSDINKATSSHYADVLMCFKRSISQ